MVLKQKSPSNFVVSGIVKICCIKGKNNLIFISEKNATSTKTAGKLTFLQMLKIP
jgi:hypothetical protein